MLAVGPGDFITAAATLFFAMATSSTPNKRTGSRPPRWRAADGTTTTNRTPRHGPERIRPGFGLRCVRVRDVEGNEEAAVRVTVHPTENAASSRSSKTRLGNTRSPKIRLARTATSGHFTRFFLPLDRLVVSSSIVRMDLTSSFALHARRRLDQITPQ